MRSSQLHRVIKALGLAGENFCKVEQGRLQREEPGKKDHPLKDKEVRLVQEYHP
jgi:hypothetical protein